jgi:hypothetical protein
VWEPQFTWRRLGLLQGGGEKRDGRAGLRSIREAALQKWETPWRSSLKLGVALRPGGGAPASHVAGTTGNSFSSLGHFKGQVTAATGQHSRIYWQAWLS